MHTQHHSHTMSDPAPVIALHCSGAGAGQWRQLGDALDSHYELAAPEHYGCDSEEVKLAKAAANALLPRALARQPR